MKNTTRVPASAWLPAFTVIANWRVVMQRAWSLRLIILITVLASVGPALPVIDEVVYIPRLLYIVAIIATGIAALVARFIPQKGITDGEL
jgi:hypothetical protein